MRGDEGSQRVMRVEKMIRGEFSVKPTGLMGCGREKGMLGKHQAVPSIKGNCERDRGPGEEAAS